MKLKRPAPITPEVWLVSRDGDDFLEKEFPSESAAVAAAPGELELQPGATFHVGRLEPYEPTLLGGDALDSVVELAREELGEEVVADWLDDVPDEKIDELEQVLSGCFRAWLKQEKLEPDFLAVALVNEHKVP